MKLALLSIFLALPLAAQPRKPAAKPPAISDALKAQFFKAQSQMIQAEAQVDQKRAAFQQVVQSLNQACGTEFHPQMNPQGDPVCVANPKK